MGLPAIRLHWQVLRLSILVNALFLFAYLYGSTLMLDQTDDELRPSARRDLAWAGQRRGSGQVVQQIPTLQSHSQAQAQAQAQCSMCDVAPELCAEIGQDRMQQALSYGGTNARLKRALAKMRSGEPWVMGVIGGSVSTGHGIDWGTDDTPPINPKYRQPNMHRLVFDHLDTRYPSSSPAISKAVALAEQRKAENANMVAPAADYAAWEGAINQDLSALPHGVGSRAYGFSGRKMGVNSLINGASPGTGSDYFGYCFLEHIPEDVDVIVIELGINDQAVTWTFEHYERMLRALLDLPNKPAIIYAEAFALAFDTMHVGADIHKGLNQYYDIPSISLRNPFLEQALSNTTFVEQMFGGKVEKAGTLEGLDLRHISQYGHAKMAELVSAYVDSVDCGMRASEPADVALLERYPQTEIPRIRLTGKYDASSHLEPARPTCQSMTAVVNKLVPSKNEGWSEWNWEEKVYLVAKKPGSKVSFDFTTAFGEVNLSYLRSREFGLGNIHCQVEGLGPEASMHIEGYWQLEFNILQTSSIKGFAPGTYTLTCELWDESADPAGGREFRIASLTR